MDAALLARLSPVTAEEARLLAGGELDKAIYSGGGGFVADRARLLEAGRLISIRPHTRFVDFPRHSHNYVEIIYMCAGGTSHLVDGRTRVELHTGELLMLNQHASHAIGRAGEGDIGVNFMVLPEFFDYALELVGPGNPLGRFIAGGLRHHGGDVGYLHFHVADLLPVQNLVENLIWSIEEKQPDRINQVTMGLLFLQLLSHTARLETAAGQRGGHALVVDALREVEENYRAASLTRLAGRYGVSVAYLSQLVRGATGRTFKQLLQEKRLARAAALLTGTDLTVGEVIEAVGYDNQSYFYRIFRRRYGVAPSAWRGHEVPRMENREAVLSAPMHGDASPKGAQRSR